MIPVVEIGSFENSSLRDTASSLARAWWAGTLKPIREVCNNFCVAFPHNNHEKLRKLIERIRLVLKDLIWFDAYSAQIWFQHNGTLEHGLVKERDLNSLEQVSETIRRLSQRLEGLVALLSNTLLRCSESRGFMENEATCYGAKLKKRVQFYSPEDFVTLFEHHVQYMELQLKTVRKALRSSLQTRLNTDRATKSRIQASGAIKDAVRALGKKFKEQECSQNEIVRAIRSEVQNPSTNKPYSKRRIQQILAEGVTLPQ